MTAIAKLIDVRQRGRERVIGAWDLGGAIVDPGPESRIETLLEGLDGGAARPASDPHPPRPRRRDRRARRAVPGSRGVRARAGRAASGRPDEAAGERRADLRRRHGAALGPRRAGAGAQPPRARGRGDDRRSRAASSTSSTRPATPPTTSSTSTESDGTAYVGDVAGVRIPPSDFVQPPTPPPDIDVEAWHALDRPGRGAASRACLALTHFGIVDDPLPHLERTKEACDEQAELARAPARGARRHRRGRPRRSSPRSTARTEERPMPATAAGLEVGSPVEQRWMGLAATGRSRPSGHRARVMATETDRAAAHRRARSRRRADAGA